MLRSMFGLRRHIYLEEKLLFPPLREAGMMMILYTRADAVLSPTARAELSAFTDEGPLPAGWVREGARA